MLFFIYPIALTLLVFNTCIRSLGGYSIDVLNSVVSMCIHFCNFIHDFVWQCMRATNDIKWINLLIADSYISNEFC